MKRAFCAIALLWVSAAAATAQTAADTQPKWLFRLPPEAIEEAYPRAALEAGAGGRAVVYCDVNTLGAAENCDVRQDEPAGQGFGAATVSLAPLFLFAPATTAGAPVSGGITFPVRYSVLYPDGAASRLRHITGDVEWARTPSMEQIAAAFPKRATASHGRVAFRCKFRPTGALRDCDKMLEEPANMGFLAAARSLTSAFQVGGDDAYRAGLAESQIYLAIELIKTPMGYQRLTKSFGGPALPLTPAAKAAGVKFGSATVECAAGVAGAPKNCRMVDETARDLGFGEIVLAAAAGTKLPLWTSEGLPLEGAVVRIRREFTETAN